MNGRSDREWQLEEIDLMTGMVEEDEFEYKDEDGIISGKITCVFDQEVDDVYLVGKNPEFEERIIKYPPVYVHFVLPSRYPSEEGPLIRIEASWMPVKLKKVIEDQIEQDCISPNGSFLLFGFRMVVQDSMDDFFEKNHRFDVEETFGVFEEHQNPQIFRRKIVEMANDTDMRIFKKKGAECEICASYKKGEEFVRFPGCQHIFCRDCFKMHFEHKIDSQELNGLTCIGCRNEPTEEFLASILSEEYFERYKSLQVDLAVHKGDLSICPRPACQNPAKITNRAKRLAECSNCGMCFCISCKRAYHAIEPCKFRKDEKENVMKEWEESSHEQRLIMSKRYGGLKQLQNLVEMFQNSNWFEENSKPCPKCRVPIEKIEGCHKMHCTKCDCYFCWLCGKVLDKENPYGHFNVSGGECEGRLFEGVVPLEDFEEDEEEFQFVFDDFLDDEDDDDDVPVEGMYGPDYLRYWDEFPSEDDSVALKLTDGQDRESQFV
ncbi:unnamed protein product [Caenorhabditis auriculariae]|uniref:RBR-type E3 ubiquitin transferase n=1 Tax=Caenorhabditis auriculariae TaxID=2777116 RepID=A0A8S1HRE4_9PELO|nr:unnamed protein product [Caenorhabditis auriculariae]